MNGGQVRGRLRMREHFSGIGPRLTEYSMRHPPPPPRKRFDKYMWGRGYMRAHSTDEGDAAFFLAFLLYFFAGGGGDCLGFRNYIA